MKVTPRSPKVSKAPLTRDAFPKHQATVHQMPANAPREEPCELHSENYDDDECEYNDDFMEFGGYRSPRWRCRWR
jgi:hypothetical protein